MALLVGCANLPPEQEASLRSQISATVPVCATEQQCKVMWAAARTWILENAGYRLQHITDDFMETYHPVGSSTRIGVTVQKIPGPNGETVLQARMYCDNPFGCQPNTLLAMRNFQEYVNRAMGK